MKSAAQNSLPSLRPSDVNLSVGGYTGRQAKPGEKRHCRPRYCGKYSFHREIFSITQPPKGNYLFGRTNPHLEHIITARAVPVVAPGPKRRAMTHIRNSKFLDDVGAYRIAPDAPRVAVYRVDTRRRVLDTV